MLTLPSRAVADAPGTTTDNLVKKANAFGIKVWSAEKLANVLDRCHAPTISNTTAASTILTATSAPAERTLSRLLKDENHFRSATGIDKEISRYIPRPDEGLVSQDLL